MKQKIIWMQLLIIGLLLFSFQSCKKGEIDKAFYEEYSFINHSDYEISIKSILQSDNQVQTKTHTLAVDATFNQEMELMSGNKTGIVAHSDSLVLNFGNVKTISFLPNTESDFNILNRNNYTKVNKESNRVKYSYIFTNEDFENANAIN